MDDFAADESNAGHRNCSGGHAQIKAIVCTHGAATSGGIDVRPESPRSESAHAHKYCIVHNYVIVNNWSKEVSLKEPESKERR